MPSLRVPTLGRQWLLPTLAVLFLTLALIGWIVGATSETYGRRKLARKVMKLSITERGDLQNSRFSEAKALLRQILELTPDSPYALYDLACAEGGSGQVAKGVAALERAAQCGAHWHDAAQTDPALAPLRNDEGYKRAMARMAENRRQLEDSLQDPYGCADTIATKRAFSTSGAVCAHYDKRRKFHREVSRWTGPWPVYSGEMDILKGRIDALSAYLESHPAAQDRMTAYLEIVRSFGELHNATGASSLVSEATVLRMHSARARFARDLDETSTTRQAEYYLMEAEWQAALNAHMVRGQSNLAGASVNPDEVRRFVRRFTELAERATGEKTELLALSSALRILPRDETPEQRRVVAKRLLAMLAVKPDMNVTVWSRCGDSLRIHTPPPEFQVVDTKGRQHSLENFKDRILVLHFEATWSTACTEERELLKTLRESAPPERVALLSVFLEDGKQRSEDGLRTWLTEHRIDWPSIYQDRVWHSDLARAFRITALPKTIVIHRGDVIASGRCAHAQKAVATALAESETR
ncbi:MAG: TlpA family protein disulfide reductase [Lentisphaeria bacterium]|nr:TlpA family protein disulfide reductase [Lentisphaeria bacterium]